MDDEMVEITTEDLVEDNNVLLNALTDLLIEKGVIAEDELKEKIEKVEGELYEEGSGE